MSTATYSTRPAGASTLSAERPAAVEPGDIVGAVGAFGDEYVGQVAAVRPHPFGGRLVLVRYGESDTQVVSVLAEALRIPLDPSRYGRSSTAEGKARFEATRKAQA